MKKILIIPLFLLFFIALAMPVHAYFDTDVNVSYTGNITNVKSLTCTDASGSLYCYMVGESSPFPNHVTIARFNETLQDEQWCRTDLSTVFTGGAMINATHMLLGDSTAKKWYYINVSAIASGVCPNSTSFGTFTTTEPWVSGALGGDYVFWSRDMGYTYKNGTQTNISTFHNEATVINMMVPNRSTTDLVYGVWDPGYDGLISEYISGVPSALYDGINYSFGLTRTTSSDLWKESASTTWIYFVKFNDSAVFNQYERPTNLYRGNFSLVTDVGASIVSAVYPRGNETIADSTPTLHAIIYTERNGTASFYVDGAFESNVTYNIGADFDAYYTTEELNEGNHFWSLIWQDQDGYIWNSGTQYFVYSSSGFSGSDDVEALSYYLDDTFSSDYGSEIFCFIVASMIAGIFFYYSGMKKFEVFIVPFMVVLGFFSMIGLFPVWFLVLQVMIIAVFIFFKVR